MRSVMASGLIHKPMEYPPEDHDWGGGERMTPTPEEMPAFAAAIIVDSRNSDMSDRGIIKLFLEILTPDGLAGSPSLDSNAWAASAAAVVFTTFLLPFGVPPPAASKSRHGGGVD